MKLSAKTSIKVFIIIISALLPQSIGVLYGQVPHASDPRGKIENLVGEGEFVWELGRDQGKRDDFFRLLKEMGCDVGLREISWTVEGGGQEWVFTRTTRMGSATESGTNASSVKWERFWISILRVDGVWITRTKYRYREGGVGSGVEDVGEKDRGSKFVARSRITADQIIISLTRKKQVYLYRIAQKGGLLEINHTSVHDLLDWTVGYQKKQ